MNKKEAAILEMAASFLFKVFILSELRIPRFIK